ncbi:hypothetical protein J1N35_024306 [Gossypium stocksii]|uniref:valine--tRNA ligase n=1 Tax=Gossypium stocksii TaxID=47602 RepID=A0A9D3VJS5_9ROSI|nr:hypothetical protein J1N35_024306 [Gossypium stocksii]
MAISDNGIFTSPELANRQSHLILLRKNEYTILFMEFLDVRWLSQGYFRPKFDRESDPFVISMPPPNVTSSLHMGHAMFVTLEVVKIIK